MADTNRILVVHQGSELYGSDRMLLQFLSVLPSHHVTLHVPDNGPLLAKASSLVKTLHVAPISVLRLHALKSLAWMNVSQIIRNMRFAWQQLQQHDSVVINSIVILSYILLLPFYRRQKFVYVHEINTGLLACSFNILIRLTGARLICNSHATADNYPLVSSARKHVIYNTVSPVTSVIAREQDSQLHLLIIGRISQRKGHLHLLEALTHLSTAEKQSVKLRIVGGTFRNKRDYIDGLHEFVGRHDLGNIVSFHEFCETPAEHYQWADCVIVPSIRPESFGLVALEAMLHRRSVIASDCGALPEIVTNGETGLIVSARSVPELAHAIKRYIAHPDLCRKHAHAGHQRANQVFAPEIYHQQINRLMNV